MSRERGEGPLKKQPEEPRRSCQPTHEASEPAVAQTSKGRAPRKPLPTGVHLSYRQEYRTCGRSNCRTCQHGLGHGPYWYAYWREGGKVHSGYVGKERPAQAPDRDRASETEKTAAAYVLFLLSEEGTRPG